MNIWHPVKVGVTGTRHGFSPAQKAWFVDRASKQPMVEFHYGDCVGVDQQAFDLLCELGGSGVFHAWPGEVAAQWRADTIRQADHLGIVVHDRMPPLVRNQHIVDSVDQVWAFPHEMVEQQRGGTWFTIRHARSHPTVSLTVVLPDGTVIT